MNDASTARNRRFWVFDRPLLHDPLWIAGLMVGFAAGVRFGLQSSTPVFATIIWAVIAVPWGILGVGCAGGLYREYWRGRHGD